VLPEDGDELGQDRYEPDLFRRTVLGAPVVVGLARVRPLLPTLGRTRLSSTIPQPTSGSLRSA
jgi:hypothetical protein